MYYLFDTCTTRNGRTRPRGRSHLRIVPIGSDNTRTKCSKPDPALKLPPIFLSLPAERDWKIEAQKAFRSGAIHFCSFPRRTMLAHPLLVIHRAADSSRRNRLSRTLYSSDPWMPLVANHANRCVFADPRRGHLGPILRQFHMILVSLPTITPR